LNYNACTSVTCIIKPQHNTPICSSVLLHSLKIDSPDSTSIYVPVISVGFQNITLENIVS